MQQNYDAIVVGGGPSGATSAALLARAGWRVAVVEKVAFPRGKVCGEFISESTWPLLSELGVSGALLKIAGPPVRRLGVYAGNTMVTAALDSKAWGDVPSAGRAVGREYLDTLLLQRAANAGAVLYQPHSLTQFEEEARGYDCLVVDRTTGQSHRLRSQVIVAAHGSWEAGPLPTHAGRRKSIPSDLFGFKAHFRGGGLPLDLMPLLAFPGGYGGMVHSDAGRVSLSCCIRRDQLERCRRESPGKRAGEAVLTHIMSSCRGASQVLAAATLDGTWLSSGPLQTGMRTFGRDGIFAVGNAAAEIHPIVAEGISIAIQSAALLSEQLIARPGLRYSESCRADEFEAARAAYSRTWRTNFSTRLGLAATLAHVFSSPRATRIAATVLEHFPQLLREGARWSGKSQPLRGTTVPERL